MAVSKGMSCYMWTTSIPTCQPPAGNLLFCSLLASCSFVWSGCAAGSVGWAGRELQKAPKNSIPSKSCCTGHCSLAGLTYGQDWCWWHLWQHEHSFPFSCGGSQLTAPATPVSKLSDFACGSPAHQCRKVFIHQITSVVTSGSP